MNKIKIAEKILSHYRAAVNPQMSHYYGIIASMGLVGMAEADNKYLPLLHEVLDAFPDSIRHPRYNFPSYRIGGIAKARAIYDGFIKDRDAELLRYAEELMTARRSQDGIISMPFDGGEKKIWIDVATAVTPFLLFAGLHFNEKKYLDEAVFQTLGMYDILMTTEVCRIGGVIVPMALAGNPVEFMLGRVSFKEQTVVGSRVYTHEHFSEGVKLLSD